MGDADTHIFTERTVILEDDWVARKAAHAARVDSTLVNYLANRSRGIKDPVLDFLFEYYNHRPAALRRWSPGIGVILQGNPDLLEVNPRYLGGEGKTFYVDARTFPAKRFTGLSWTIELLESTSNRPPSFGCHGLHEWAMVYRQSENRHSQFPLRLGRVETDAVVESNNITCSHFDAFRFFTPSAQPMNTLELSRAAATLKEQAGCLHANMDLYKWAYKFSPWISSDIVLDAFQLAVRIRRVDMAASPYDLSSIGVDPIRIETSEGQRQYRSLQTAFYEQSMPIRARLLSALEHLSSTASESSPVTAAKG